MFQVPNQSRSDATVCTACEDLLGGRLNNPIAKTGLYFFRDISDNATWY